MQFGISCLTAVVSPVQSKNMDLFFRQRIALGQLVLTCLPFYLVLVEVVADELVQIRLLVIRLVIYRIELQHPVIPVSLQRAFADAQQQAYFLIVVQTLSVQVVQVLFLVSALSSFREMRYNSPMIRSIHASNSVLSTNIRFPPQKFPIT